MEIDTNYASKGVGNAGLTLGIIGTALSVLNGGFGLMGNNASPMGYSPVLAEKDAEIARLKSENYTNEKLNALERQMCANQAAQAVVNAQLSNLIAVNGNNLTQLMDLTKLTIPSTSVYTVTS